MKKLAKLMLVVLVIVMVCAVLTACVPNTAAKATEKMTKKDYIGGSSALVNAAIKLVVGKVEEVAVYTNGNDSITAAWFTEAEDAKKLYDNWKTDDSKKNLGRSGNCVYFGTEQAVKDFKGF